MRPVGVLAPGTAAEAVGESVRALCCAVAVIWEGGWPGEAFGDACREGVPALPYRSAVWRGTDGNLGLQGCLPGRGLQSLV